MADILVNGTYRSDVPKIYLSGPMRGKPEWNREAFLDCAGRWRDDGWEVFSPYEQLVRLGFSTEEGSDEGRIREVAILDTQALIGCNAIGLLFEWDKSLGCTMELALAQFLGIDVWCAVTMRKLNLVKCPWKAVNRLPELLSSRVEDAIRAMEE